MRLADFSYDLPEELIAQRPLAERSASRLLHVDCTAEAPADRAFRDLPDLLAPGDLMVFNDTRVIRARLFGHKDTGGRVEILIERLHGADRAFAQVRASKSPRPGARITLEDATRVQVLGRDADGLFEIVADGGVDLAAVLERCGHMPLPPYIERADDEADRERYQTVFAARPGAVAAPTAGLHFDAPLLARLAERGIESTRVTLHVGAGTFVPVRSDNVDEHRMHSEWYQVDADTVAAVAAARARGARVVAVGTTALRALESASAGGSLRAMTGDTRLFIRPGYRFHTVDALVTNFHLPESTLLMLVAAYAGRERILAAYRHAVQARYRFFSYGDAMLLTGGPVEEGA